MRMIVIKYFFLSILHLSIIFSKNNNAIQEKGSSNSFITFADVKFDVKENGESPNRFIWLHGDEQTARMALDDHIQRYEGIAFFIRSKTREVPFKNTIIDPNRIFSRQGAYHALKKFKPGWRSGTLQNSLDELDKQRKLFLDILMPGENGILVALHNNFRGYNVNKEKDRSQRTSIKADQNPRDFIICTNENDFEIIASSPYNVVLQNLPPEQDDGSLSWEALRQNVRYINIETRLGYLTKQKKMLRYIEENLN